jgi:hypothetical protein
MLPPLARTGKATAFFMACVAPRDMIALPNEGRSWDAID